MKSVLISIQPKWCELIANGKKTVEVRKTKPKLNTPFKVYIYCTNTKTMGDFILCKSKENAKLFGFNVATGINKGFAKAEDIQLKGKVIGEFVCRKIDRIAHCGTCKKDIRLNIVDENFYYKELNSDYLSECKLSYYDIDKYSNGRDVYGWHISDLVIYDKPKSLSEFEIECKGGCDIPYIYHPPCETCRKNKLTRPPQSWCYVEKGGAE